jgi:succinate dehydrogenase / fumarate reductase, cytochrome b subunit
MNKFSQFLHSSLGNKLLMSFTGLFLILFLVVHLIGNLQLLIPDQGEAFNAYVRIMEKNILIKVVAYALYIAILLHTYKGIDITLRNRKARGGQRYAVKAVSGTTWASRNMALLGSLIFIFIGVYTMVDTSFSELWIVVFYALAQIVLAYHLLHGFQSAFQTLGLRDGNYTRLFKGIGAGIAVGLPLLFAIIPILMYFDIHPMPDFRVFPGQ